MQASHAISAKAFRSTQRTWSSHACRNMQSSHAHTQTRHACTHRLTRALHMHRRMHEHTPKPPACHTHTCPRTRRHRHQGSGRRARCHGSRRRGFGHINLHVGPRGPSTLQRRRQDVWRQDVLTRHHDPRRRAQGLFSEIFSKWVHL
jgi:hypothetical protein